MSRLDLSRIAGREQDAAKFIRHADFAIKHDVMRRAIRFHRHGKFRAARRRQRVGSLNLKLARLVAGEKINRARFQIYHRPKPGAA